MASGERSHTHSSSTYSKKRMHGGRLAACRSISCVHARDDSGCCSAGTRQISASGVRPRSVAVARGDQRGFPSEPQRRLANRVDEVRTPDVSDGDHPRETITQVRDLLATQAAENAIGFYLEFPTGIVVRHDPSISLGRGICLRLRGVSRAMEEASLHETYSRLIYDGAALPTFEGHL